MRASHYWVRFLEVVNQISASEMSYQVFFRDLTSINYEQVL